MATLSGRVIFDRDRSLTISGSDSGLANIPVVLQNISTSQRLTVLTDSAGNYSFINVPNGNYRVVESYGASGGVPTPGDFSLAAPGSVPSGVNPPITAAQNPPPGSTNLDSLTPDTLLITVTGANIGNLNFFNGPVIYTPIETILDPCAFISGDNLIGAADEGTFGSFPPGTPANTGAPVEPYPGVTPDFVYVLPNPDTYTPFGGQYTVQNIMNNALSEVIGAWWRIADHTEGNETGRMMVVNGDNPGAVFFRDQVFVQPNTNYLFTAWILNLFKVTGYPNPELGVRILAEDGSILYSATLGTLIPPSLNAPEWKQIGSVVNSQNNSSLTVEFLSEGPEVIGNDYAIDDISFNEIQVPEFIPVKTVDRQTATVGEVVRFTVTLSNTCQSPLTNLFFRDLVPEGLSFVPDTVTVNDVLTPGANPDIGFPLPDVPGGSMVTVAFDAKVNMVPVPNPALNQASIRYSYTPVEGGIPGTYLVTSNEVPVFVTETADIAVVKTASPSPVVPGSTLTYTINVSNQGPSPAENVLLTDSLPASLSGAEFSVDGGGTFYPWPGTYSLGTLLSGETRTIIIRATVAASATGNIVNTAVVESSTPDPDPSNNTSTAVTPVVDQADLSVVKLGSPNPVAQGELLTYTLTISNAGPAAAVGTILTDPIPASLLNPEYSLGGSAFQPWTGTLSLGTLEPGAVVIVQIRGTVSPAAVGIISNTATVSSSTPDPDLSNNSSTNNTEVTARADLAVTKTGSPSPVPAGSQLTYTLNVENLGPGDAQNVLLTDPIPAQLVNAQYSLDGGATFQPWTGSVSLGTLAANTARTVLIRGTVQGTATGVIANTAIVSSSTPDPNPDNNEDTEITPINTSADLSVTKSGSPSPVLPGQTLTFTLTVRNAGPNPAIDTVLADAVPPQFTGAEYSVDNGATWLPWTGSLSLGTLDPNAVRTVLIRGTVSSTASGLLTNTAIVQSATPDPNPNNNQDTALIPVNESADLSIVKTASPVPVTAGGQISYTLPVTNAGPSPAQNVVLTDDLPPEILNPEFAVQGGTNFAPWVSPYSIGTLAPGETFLVTIRGTVDPSASSGTLTNTATVQSATPDPNPDNNTDTAETPVVESADLSVTKTADQTPAVPGQLFSYTITVTNSGPSDARNVLLIDALPAVLLNPLVSIDNGSTYFAWSSPFMLGTLAAGTSRTIRIRGTLSPSATGELVNTAVVKSTTPDPDLDNNTDTDVTPIRPSADLSVIKAVEQSPVLAGGQIQYSLLISNAGPSEAENVVLTDALPPELSGAEISADNGVTWVPFSGVYLAGNLAVGAAIRLLIRAVVSPEASGLIRNTAMVGSSTPDPDPDNNRSTVETPVSPSADLSITKSAAPNPVEAGGTLTYTLTVTNAGPSNAVNVVVQDQISSELADAEYSVDGGATWQPWTNLYRIGALAAGQTFVILIRGTVLPASSGSIVNFATVSSDTPDPDPDNNTAQDTVDIIASTSADVSVTKSAIPSTAVIGEFLTYQVTVTNYGPNPAENVTLSDELSPILANTEFSLDRGANWSPWGSSLALGTLAPGESVLVLIRGLVTPNACDRICNTATVTSTTPDPDLENNTAVLSTPLLRGADLSISKTARIIPSSCGPLIIYTLTVCNAGPETARQVVITDELPPEICDPVYSADHGLTQCPWNGQFSVLELPAGECICILIQGWVNPCAGQRIVNTATVTSATTDPNLCNNRDCVCVELTQAAWGDVAGSGDCGPF